VEKMQEFLCPFSLLTLLLGPGGRGEEVETPIWRG